MKQQSDEGFAIDTTVLSLISHYGLPLLALLICAGELGLPTFVPIETAILLTGAYVVHSVPMLLAGVLLVAAADILGTTSLHLMMRTGGVRLLDRLLSRHREKAERTMNRWRTRLAGRDTSVVFVGRIMPMIRMYITIGTGLLRIPFRNFIAGAAPAAIIWSGTPLVVGYLIRDHVLALQARYATVSHVALTLMPAFGLVTATAWWVRSGHSLHACLRRGRSALGFIAAVVTTGYLAAMVWKNDWALDQGSGVLPRPVLIGWIALLAALALILLGFAYADFRASSPRRQRRRLITRGHLIANELLTTTAWLTLLFAIATIVARIELLYPAL
ncbi:MAG: DedA family protein [Thermomicrobiales bacterium]